MARDRPRWSLGIRKPEELPTGEVTRGSGTRPHHQRERHDLWQDQKETHNPNIDQRLELLKEMFGQLLTHFPLEPPTPTPGLAPAAAILLTTVVP